MLPWPIRRVASVLSHAAVLAMVAVPVGATVRHVPGDYPTIQAAIDASTFGDQVLVDPGTYEIQGGGITIGPAADGIRLASTGGPEVTIIKSVPILNEPPDTRHVVSCFGVGASTIVEGFTITGGAAGNFVDGGGGMILGSSDVVVRNNIITGNSCAYGGGIFVLGGSPTISGNTITGNGAFNGGGGIYYDVGAGSIDHNVIVGNGVGNGPYGRHGGGGISIGSSPSATISECTIVGNTAPVGAGLFVEDAGSPTMSRTVVAFNRGNGVEIDNFNPGSLSIDCSDVFGNSDGNFVGMADPTGTNGNQSADPLFCDLTTRDLTISTFSPCAPAHSPSGCDLVGALPPSCSVTPAKRSTWGQLKARYR